LRSSYYKYKKILLSLGEYERNKIAVIMLVIAFLLLIPGLFEPVLTITAKFGGFVILDRTKSIIGNILTLMQDGYVFVAFLVFLFSVVVPVTKAILLLIALYMKHPSRRYKIYAFIGLIGKWSMADVFLIGIFVSYLSANALKGLYAIPRIGFYFFAAYCILSVLSHQIMVIKAPDDHS